MTGKSAGYISKSLANSATYFAGIPWGGTAGRLLVSRLRQNDITGAYQRQIKKVQNAPFDQRIKNVQYSD